MTSGEKKRKTGYVKRAIGTSIAQIDSITVNFDYSPTFELNQVVAVPRHGDRFDYGVIIAINPSTVTVLLGREPLLQKDLPFVLAGRLGDEETIDIPVSPLERVNALERSCYHLHEFLLTGDSNLLTTAVRCMISFVHLHCSKLLAMLAKNQLNSRSQLPGTASTKSIMVERKESWTDESTAEPSSAVATLEMLEQFADCEKKCLTLQHEALCKLNEAQSLKWTTVQNLLRNRTTWSQ